MIETTILDYLMENLDVPVGYEAAEDTRVVLEKTGSSRSNFIISSTFAVQSYGDSMLEAMELNEVVKSVMTGLISLPEVTRVTLDTDYNFTDAQTKRYRYQAVYTITHY